VVEGYEVRVLDLLKTRLLQANEAGLPQPARLLLALPGVAFTADMPSDSEQFDYMYDRPLAKADARRWRRRLRIASDLFSAYRLRAPIIAPYGMYPAHLQSATPEVLRSLRTQPRRMRVFFAGDSKGYVRNRVRYPAPKLPRYEVLQALRAGISDRLIEVAGVDDIDRLTVNGFVDGFVLSDSGSGIPQHRWLPTVANADFFLCPPGIVMPMCHNVIEAMAVGTIPVISYPEWFYPKLEHGRNCVAFDTRQSLVERMQKVLELSDDDIRALRANVIRYYDQYLRPGRLVEAIEERTEADLTILIYTELNMSSNEKKLGPRSVLIRGPQAGGLLRRIGRMMDSHRGPAMVFRMLSTFARRVSSNPDLPPPALP
jgi:hypothetical protein